MHLNEISRRTEWTSVDQNDIETNGRKEQKRREWKWNGREGKGME
jgi:hypothetical protein